MSDSKRYCSTVPFKPFSDQGRLCSINYQEGVKQKDELDLPNYQCIWFGYVMIIK